MKGKIFNAQEVQAIISGNKTQFREVIKSQPIDEMVERREYWGTGLHGDPRWEKAPYQVGQKIFCKEKFRLFDAKDCNCDHWNFEDCNCAKQLNKPMYFSEDIDPEYTDWKPAQHMKQEHSRLTLEITGIRVERLADISEEDAIAEGFTGFCNEEGTWEMRAPWKNKPDNFSTKNVFKRAWNATHKKPEEKFEANPWVWCVSMEVVK